MTTWSMGANRAVAEAATTASCRRSSPVRIRAGARRSWPSSSPARSRRSCCSLRRCSSRVRTRSTTRSSPPRPWCSCCPTCSCSLPRSCSGSRTRTAARPFRIPGGTKVVAALAAVATFVIAATALFFMWPEIPHRPADWSYTGPLLGIVAGALIIGEVLIWRGMHSARPAKPPKARRRRPRRRPRRHCPAPHEYEP